MNVGEFFQKLSYGELSSLSVGLEGAGAIAATSQDSVVSYTNSALKALYSRFTHKKDYVKLELVDGLNRYKFSPLYAVSNVDGANTNPRYIQDTALDPFKDDLIKILSITQEDDPDTIEDETQDLKINVHPVLGGVKSLSFNEIYVPNPVAGTILTIEYQANHAELSTPTVLSEEIVLAPILHEALEMRVAARVFGAIGGEAHLVKAQTLQTRYEHIALLAETNDLIQETETGTTDRLRDKGFV